jgi:AsmA-like C-terminal region
MVAQPTRPSTQVAFTRAVRTRNIIRLFIAIVGGALVTLWAVAAIGSRTSVLRNALVSALEEHLDADVELQSFSATNFPLLRISGEGLRVRLKNQAQKAPLVEIRRFEVSGSISGLLHRQRRFRAVTLEGLRITIPPRTPNDREAGGKAASTMTGPVLIDRVESTNAELVIMPGNPEKGPRVFAIHDLRLDDVGFHRSMPFHATLTNPTPSGLIETSGVFGPWRADAPGLTPLSGHYAFEHANLATIHGIAGTLSSTGDFAGQLSRIDVRGRTSTPDFSIDVGGQPVPLDTQFHAVVDGTDGNTYLNRVEARLQQTPITASGSVAGQKGVKGRTVKLDVELPDGRIEDVLRLAVKADQPVMTGKFSLTTTLVLPPGEQRVADRLELHGRFSLAETTFTDKGVQTKLIEMSNRSRGRDANAKMNHPLVSNMDGQFTLRHGAVRFSSLVFQLPGARVNLAGHYGLRSEALDFAGTFRMDASVSEAAGGGWKGALLKPINPLFRKKGAGAVLPIKITGTRRDPKFGLDWGKALTRR